MRQTLRGLAEAIDLDASDANDINIAVTEACNNTVVHAYGGREGPLEIEVHSRSDVIEVIVRDHGTGIPPPPSEQGEAAGIGVSLIRALARRVEFRAAAGVGTEVQMAFAAPGAQALAQLPADSLELPALVETELATAMEIAVTPAHLARTILPRLLSALAARAHFRTDRISDMQLIADALSARVPASIRGNHVSIGISIEPHDLELRIAPFDTGRASQLVLDHTADGMVPVIGKLTDHQRVVSIDSSADAEMLALRLADRR